MAQYGIQWDINALNGKGQIQWIECKPPYKILIQQSKNIYSIKPEFYSNLEQVELNKELFDKYGTGNINDLLLERNRNSVIQEDSIKLGESKVFEFKFNNDFKSIDEVKYYEK